jgi:hypothetical protein
LRLVIFRQGIPRPLSYPFTTPCETPLPPGSLPFPLSLPTLVAEES